MKDGYIYKGKTENGTEIELTMGDMCAVSQFYEACCTAEYLIDNGRVKDGEVAFEVGCEVRRLMDKYGYTEDEAIEEALEE